MHNSIAQKVLESVDIVEVIQERVPLTRRGKEYVGLCPFHPDHSPSLFVNPKKQIFKCFVCGAGGDALKFVQMRERVSFREALAALAQRAGISLDATPEQRQASQARDQVRQAVVWAREYFRRNLESTPGGRAAREYALRRGLTNETITRHNIGFAADGWDDLLGQATRAGVPRPMLEQAGLVATNETGRTYDRFRNRLIFPIADALGRPVAFGGRALGDDPAKYLNSPETSLFSKSRILDSLDLARDSIEKQREAIIVEGYMDAVLLHQFGFTNTVGALGTALTDPHVRLLKQRADKLVLCFDGDAAGVRAADRAAEVSLAGAVEVRVVVLKDGLDPADYVLAHGAEGFGAALRASVDALEFKWSLTKRTYDGSSPRGRRAALDAFLAFVGRTAVAGGIDPLGEGLLVARMSELLDVPKDELYPMFAAARKLARRSERPTEKAAENEPTYMQAVHGLPNSVILSVESVFGLLLADPSLIGLVDGKCRDVMRRDGTWERLYRLIDGLVSEQPAADRAAVMARCDDAQVLELVSRGSAAAKGIPASRASMTAQCAEVTERMATSANLQVQVEKRSDLRKGGADAASERAMAELLAAARGHDSPLPAATLSSTRLN